MSVQFLLYLTLVCTTPTMQFISYQSLSIRTDRQTNKWTFVPLELLLQLKKTTAFNTYKVTIQYNKLWLKYIVHVLYHPLWISVFQNSLTLSEDISIIFSAFLCSLFKKIQKPSISPSFPPIKSWNLKNYVYLGPDKILILMQLNFNV